jgi:Na+/melibiose symporter-like transporter
LDIYISGLPLILLLQNFSFHSVLLAILAATVLLFIFSAIFIKTHPDYISKRKNLIVSQSSHEKNITTYLSLIRNPQLLINGLYCLCICGTTAIFADLWGISYFNHVFGYSEESAAYACSLIFLGVAFSSPLWGFLASIIDNNKILSIICSAIGIFLLSILLYIKVNLITLCILCFLFGSVQSVHALNFTIIARQVDKKNLGIGVAFINLFIPLSGAIFQPISGALIQMFEKTTSSQATAYELAMLIIPVLLIIATLLALAFKENKDLDSPLVYTTAP